MNAGLGRSRIIDMPTSSFEANLRFMEAAAVGAHEDDAQGDGIGISRAVKTLTEAGVLREGTFGYIVDLQDF